MPPTFTLGLPVNRRDALISASALAASFAFLLGTAHAAGLATLDMQEGEHTMGYVTTGDDVQIFYKDWGPKDAQPIVFHHGWPLSSDDWDAQMLFFLSKGSVAVGHGRPYPITALRVRARYPDRRRCIG
jgi:non-heme chloroperoxidase